MNGHKQVRACGRCGGAEPVEPVPQAPSAKAFEPNNAARPGDNSTEGDSPTGEPCGHHGLFQLSKPPGNGLSRA